MEYIPEMYDSQGDMLLFIIQGDTVMQPRVPQGVTYVRVVFSPAPFKSKMNIQTFRGSQVRMLELCDVMR